MTKWKSRLYQTDRARDFDHEKDRQVRARQVYETIDRQGFQWIVVFVAGIGFFLDGYTLFASNIAVPMIAYVYWNDEVSHEKITLINIATIAGTMLGQLVFGLLADAKGRRRMYGVELVVLLMSTLGVIMSSTGENNSMSIFGWLVAWRVIAGIGVGADYPLSGVIASEFAPTAQRARMLAAMFFMQPLGQICSTLVSIAVITITRRTTGEEDILRSVDIMWRWIIGAGIIPGVLALLFRLAIPETPRFMLEIQDDPIKAEFDAAHLFGDADEEDLVSSTSNELETGAWTSHNTPGVSTVSRPTPSIISMTSTSPTFYDDKHEYTIDHDHHEDRTSALITADWTVHQNQQTTTHPPTLNSPWPTLRPDLYKYFIQERNYLTLLSTSLSWLLVDIGFYGISLSSPHFLAKTWGTLSIHGRSPPWKITDDPSVSVYDQFLSTTVHALVILNAGCLLGGILLILFINRLNRVSLQRWGFLFLAAVFITMGVVFTVDGHRYQSGVIAVTLYIVAQTAFNFGPNATTFILPAEVFPTRYRASCHGVSAAMGKLGCVVMLVVNQVMAEFAHAKHGDADASASGDSLARADALRGERDRRYANTMLGFGVVMVLGAVVSLLLPQVQVRSERSVSGDGRAVARMGPLRSVRRGLGGTFAGGKLRSMTLEELSVGRKGEKVRGVRRRRTDRR